jgi:ribosome biogenesis protein BMS1
VLVDRHEDITDPNLVDEDKNCERSIVLYGYVRGTHLKPNMKVHLIGVGDFDMGSVRLLEDPLPAGKRDDEQKVRIHFARMIVLIHSYKPVYVPK